MSHCIGPMRRISPRMTKRTSSSSSINVVPLVPTLSAMADLAKITTTTRKKLAWVWIILKIFVSIDFDIWVWVNGPKSQTSDHTIWCSPRFWVGTPKIGYEHTFGTPIFVTWDLGFGISRRSQYGIWVWVCAHLEILTQTKTQCQPKFKQYDI